MANFIERYYIKSGARGRCLLFCLFPFTLFIWYLISLPSLRNTTLPTCSIQEFYVPALDKLVNTTIPNNTIFFDIKLQNNILFKGVRYAPINLTFYYGSVSSLAVGNCMLPGFDQGMIFKSADKRHIVEARGVPWLDARRLVSNGSTTSFRVDLGTSVRFKYLGMHFKKHDMIVGAQVEVDDSGEKVGKAAIKLKSSTVTCNIGHPRGNTGGIMVTDI